MKKKKCCIYLCPDSVYFHMLLLISYLSAIKTLTCRREISLGSTFFRFAQNTIHDFNELIVALSLTNATK